MERLNHSDRDFICRYKRFEENIRHQERSTFDTSYADHLQIIKRKSISVKTEIAQVNAVLSYHDWACARKKNISSHYCVSIPEILVSYEDLFHYCKMRDKKLGLKVWSHSKICMAILRMLQFIEAKMQVGDDVKEAIMEMRDYSRALLAKAKREQVRLNKGRPSVDELREQGKMLSFTELAKVCQKQEWRVKVLVKNYKRSRKMQQVIGPMLRMEIMRLAVISTLVRYPVRKGEFEACSIDMSTTPWRLKLIADDRKSGQSINNRLSRNELDLFQLLLQVRQTQDEDDSINMTWRPFEGSNTTEILKSITRDIAGVPMTIMALRTAAESHVDLIGRADIQTGLSFAEGHTERIAKQYYKRNGSTTIMKPWIDHIDGLLHGRNIAYDSDSFDGELDEKIDKRMQQSQQKWKEKIEKEIRDLKNNERAPVIKRKVRKNWSEEEDAELRKHVRVHGEGNWRDILNHSRVLQERYQSSTVHHARDSLKTRWRVLSRRQVIAGSAKRSADDRIIMHRRKKKRVEQPALDSTATKMPLTAMPRRHDIASAFIAIRSEESLLFEMVDNSITAANEVTNECDNFAHSGQLHELDECDDWSQVSGVRGVGDKNTRCMRRNDEADRGPVVTKERKTWEYRYKELHEFKGKYGHCEVPRTPKGSPSHSPLGKWVANQREDYKKFRAGQASSLTEEKVDLLNLIGFTWRLDRSSPRQSNSAASLPAQISVAVESKKRKAREQTLALLSDPPHDYKHDV